MRSIIEIIRKRIAFTADTSRVKALQIRLKTEAIARDKNHLEALLLLSELNEDMTPEQMKDWDKDRIKCLNETIA